GEPGLLAAPGRAAAAMIPRFRPDIGRRELWALVQPGSDAVERFEREFARAFGARDAVAFPYGRSALWAFLQAVGVRDAEVVIPAYTCSVVAHAVSLSGNRPRFVDIRLSDYNMDLDLLPGAINAGTRAVVATHLFGYPLDLDRVEAIVAQAQARHGHKIWLIQDCAHSFGAAWGGRVVGSSGDVALYALNISKSMTAIFGGMLTFQDAELALRLRAWRDAHFRRASALKPWLRRLYLLAVAAAFTEPVYGLTWWLQEKTPLLDRLTRSYHLDEQIHFPPDHLDRMLDVEAAVGLAQLAQHPHAMARRRENAAFYDQHLPRQPGWVLPPLVDGATYSHYVVRVPDRAASVRAAAHRGVHLGELIQYSVPELSGYAGSGAPCEQSRLASRCTINLPVHPSLTPRQLQKVVDALR
ncbi:MAG TPA: DegT/DnrJ/EryC1/StrS family aminotransferase, partial [Burkholderiaceae bacterium]